MHYNILIFVAQACDIEEIMNDARSASPGDGHIMPGLIMDGVRSESPDPSDGYVPVFGDLFSLSFRSRVFSEAESVSVMPGAHLFHHSDELTSIHIDWPGIGNYYATHHCMLCNFDYDKLSI